jgi:Flp pilus assembly protein TadB
VYNANRPKRTEGETGDTPKIPSYVKFAFVWVLAGLLVFYIVSVYLNSTPLFAIGNIVVEVLLVLYLLKNKTRQGEDI